MNTQIAAEDETKYFYMMECVILMRTSFLYRVHRRTSNKGGEEMFNADFLSYSVDVVQKWWEKWSWCEKWMSLDSVE